MEKLKGEYVTLVPAEPHHRKQIYEWLARSDLTLCMLGPPVFTDNAIPTWEEFAADYNVNFFNDNDPLQGRSYLIKFNDEYAGHINYNEILDENGYTELDIWLACSRFCNKGYGTDAINTLCSYLNSLLNCKTFVLAPSARNDRAIRAYQKCGFQITGQPLKNFIPDYTDTVIMVKHL